MKRIIFIIAVSAVIFISYGQNVKTLLPYTGAPGSYLNEQIIQDTIATGGLLPDRVYELQRGGVYIHRAIFNVPSGKTLRFRAAEGAGKKPIIYLYPTGTGAYPLRTPGYFVVLNGGDLEIKNVCISGYYEPFVNQLDVVQSGLINTAAHGSSITLDGVILSNINGQCVRTGFNTVKILITNSIFANMGALTTSNIGSGKAIDLREAACDSLILINNTFVNYQDRAIRHYNFANPALGTGLLNYARIDHNTFINGMGYHGLFSLGTVGNEINISNNLFVDAFNLGEDSTDFTRTAEWYNTNEYYSNGNNRITWIYSNPNNTTQWNIRNNYYTISDSGRAFLNDYGFGTASHLSMNIYNRLQEQGADTSNLFTSIDLSLQDIPRLMTNLMRWYESPTGGNKTKNTPSSFFVKERDDYDRRTIFYYRDTLNASYSNSSAAYNNSTGFPAGDLNWFPEKKAEWLPPAATILNYPIDGTINLSLSTSLSWKGTTGVDWYNLQVSTTPDFAAPVLDQTGISDTEYTYNGLQPLTAYYWRVRGANQADYSAWSATWGFTTTDFVPAPSNLVADAPEPGSITLTWTDNSANETGFNIERKKEGEENFIIIAGADSNALTYSDTTIEENEIYIYKLKAFNSLVESDYSNEFRVISPISTIAHPTNLRVASDSLGNFLLEWEDNSENEDGFIIERFEQTEDIYTLAKNAGNTFSFIYTPIDTVPSDTRFYSDSNVQESSTYKYLVRAFSSAGISIAVKDTNSEPIRPLIAPSNLLSGLIGYNSIRLTWMDNSDFETNYVIERDDSAGFVEIAVLPSNSVTYDDLNLEYNKIYIYRIYAKNNNSKSAYTNEKEELTIPVELVSFSGLFENSFSRLNWVTATEENNAGFEVQRSFEFSSAETDNENKNPDNWETVGFVEGKGTTTEPNVYEFTDDLKTVDPGIIKIKYRLKQIDFAGSYKYSQVVIIEVSRVPLNFSLSQNYPNPFNPVTTITFEISEPGFYTIKIFDMLGQEALTLVNAYYNPGKYNVNFNGINFTSGIYMYKLLGTNVNLVRKMILAK